MRRTWRPCPPGTVRPAEPSDFLAVLDGYERCLLHVPWLPWQFWDWYSVGQGTHTKRLTAALGTDESFARAVECGKCMVLAAWKVSSDDGFADDVMPGWKEDMLKASQE